MTFCDPTTETEVCAFVRTDEGRTAEGQADVEVKIVTYLDEGLTCKVFVWF